MANRLLQLLALCSCVFLLGGGCADGGSSPDAGGPDTDTDTDSDTDSDTESDTDSGTDSDTDSGTDSGIDTDTDAECDGAGDCDACLSCVDANGLCAVVYEVCAVNEECTALTTCALDCGDDAACVAACASSFPGGAVDYTLMNNCVYCEECASDCAAEAIGCPEAPGAPQLVVAGDATKLLLHGAVVTPTEAFAGEVLVEDDLITCVAASCSGEAGAATASIVVTNGIVMPGLIDAHNHILYDIFDATDWAPAVAYENHNQWPEDEQYGAMVDAKQYLNGESPSPVDYNCEMIKYGEIKALISGTTSVQGSANPANKICYRTLARTIDQSANGLCGTVPPQSCDDKIQAATLFPTTSSADGVCANIADDSTDSYLVHIGEGVDSVALAEFDELNTVTTVDGCLFVPETAVIHGTAFGATEFATMGAAGMGLIWSPRSNVFLYGLSTDLSKTTDIPTALGAGIIVGLGPDWSLGGSQNMLDEIRFVDEVDDAEWGDILTPQDIVEMATINGSELLATGDQIGALAVGMKADIAVIGGDASAPYDAILAATPADVGLVLVDGVVLYGDDQLEPLGNPSPGCEAIDVCEVAKFLCVAIDGGDASNKFGQTYAEIETALTDALVAYDALDLSSWDFSPLTPLVTCP